MTQGPIIKDTVDLVGSLTRWEFTNSALGAAPTEGLPRHPPTY